MEEIRQEITNNDTMGRWSVLIQQWQTNLSQVDALLIRDGIEDEEVIKLKTVAVQEWLFRFEFINSIIIVSKEHLIFFGNADKAKLFKLATEESLKAGKKVSVIEKSETVSQDEIKKLFVEINRLEAKTFGVFSREKQKGKMIELFDEEFKRNNYAEVDMSTSIQEILSVKLPADIKLLEASSKVTTYFFSQFINNLEGIIDDNSRLPHSELSKQMEDLLVKSKSTLERKFNVKSQFFDYAYSPVIQSGGEYDLRPNAENTDSKLSYDCILLNMSGKYLSMICNVFRTLMINPTEQDKNNYKALLDIHRKVIKNIKAGKVLHNIYEDILNYTKETYPHLVDKLPINFGFGIGYEFKESCLLINKKNTKKVEAGNCFTIITSFKDLTGFTGKPYCMHLSDTVYVDKEGVAINLTNTVPCEFEDVGYNIEDEEHHPETNGVVDHKPSTGIVTRAAKRGLQLGEEHARGEKMRLHQKELMDAKITELEERVKSGNFIETPEQNSKLIVEKLQTYSDDRNIPNLPKNSVQIDAKNYAVLLPMGKKLVPFHIACIKNVTKHSENNQALLRINFQTPGLSGNTVFPTITSFGSQPLYIKELTITSMNGDSLTSVAKQVKELQKKYRLNSSLAAKQVKENEKTLLRGKLKTLNDVKMRPTLTGKKTVGSLTSFANGFKLVSNRNEVFEILLSNVKHAFFQPADDDMIVIIHFHLYNPVVVNKKLTQNVQFFTEIGIANEDLADPRRRRRAEFDEYEEEQMEEQARERFNKLYLDFCEYTEKNWESDLQFEQPYADLGFYGSFASNNVMLCPSAHCLVSLIESPFLVVTLSEIEIVSFERLDNKIKNFDMILIFKDYTRVVTVSNIPKTSLELLKEWLE